jgi:membrane fusion protein, multidrug efflux system
MNKKKWIFSVIVLLVVVLGSVWIIMKLIPTALQQQMPPTVIQTFTVKTRPWQRDIQATGTLEAFYGTTLKSETTGRITKIYFKSGQIVKKGDSLVQIYPDLIKAQLMQHQADLKLSQLKYSRGAKLYEKKYVAKQALDALHEKMQADQAQVNYYQANLDQALIKAPFAGRVGLRHISLGTYVSPGDSIVDIQSLDPMRAKFNVPSALLGKIHINDKITIKSMSFEGTHDGNIYAFNSQIDPDTRYMDMLAQIPNKDNKLTPGSFIDVAIHLGKPIPTIIVPQDAIVYSMKNNFVYKVVDKKALKTQIKLGQKLDDDKVIVLQGLKDGDIIVTGGQMKLTDGGPVVTEEEMTKKLQQTNKQK